MGKAKEPQRETFERTARELGVELDEDKLKEALRRMRATKEPPERSDEDQSAG